MESTRTPTSPQLLLPFPPRPEPASTGADQVVKRIEHLIQCGELDPRTAQALIVGTQIRLGHFTLSDVLQLIREVADLKQSLRSMADAWAHEIYPGDGCIETRTSRPTGD